MMEGTSFHSLSNSGRQISHAGSPMHTTKAGGAGISSKICCLLSLKPSGVMMPGICREMPFTEKSFFSNTSFISRKVCFVQLSSKLTECKTRIDLLGTVFCASISNRIQNQNNIKGTMVFMLN